MTHTELPETRDPEEDPFSQELTAQRVALAMCPLSGYETKFAGSKRKNPRDQTDQAGINPGYPCYQACQAPTSLRGFCATTVMTDGG